MENRNKLIRDNRHVLYVLTVLAVMLTVYSLPKEKGEQYAYTVGKPWTHNMLIAPSNFDIEKDYATYHAQLDSVEASHVPYFTMDGQAVARVLGNLDRLYADSLHGLVSYASWHSVRDCVQRVYRRGIVEASARNILEGRQVLHIGRPGAQVFSNADSVMDAAAAGSIVRQAVTDSLDRMVMASLSLERLLEPNLQYDSTASANSLQEQLNAVSRYAGTVLADEKIIGQGEMVDREKDLAIKSYLKLVNEKVSSRRFQLLTWGGQSLFVIGCFLLLMFYLMLYRIDNIENRNVLYFLYSFVTLFNVAVGLYLQYAPWTVMLIPCTILPLVLRVFLDSRTAFAGYLVFVLSTSISVPMPYEYVLLQIAAGLVAIYSLKELSERSQILWTCLFIFLTYCVVWFSIQIIKVENFKDLDAGIIVPFALNSFLVMLQYPLLFIIEKTFGFTSNVTLIELSNINNPLLRNLAEKAPGTFQHSMQVSTLAAHAAQAVKANSQLVRTAALYHDIGKIESAPFFTENQNGVNPHDRLTPQQSARIITDHVEAGLALASKYGLPASIKEFIATHHGAGMARYFYLKFKQEHPDMEPDVRTFSYPGPNPSTKETAILMMADAAEAASRSLKEYTEQSISELVDRIVDRQESDGYFRSCPLNWQEIGKIKESFKEQLRTMYHTRISYPDDTTAGQRQKTL